VVLGMVDNPRACLEIDRLCADPTLLAVASHYLGYRPQHVEPRLYWSFVCGVTREDRPARWQTVDYHLDVDGYSFIYANFYITSVDRNSGAHAYIRAPAYGDGICEVELGKFIRGQRERFVIATKYGDPLAEAWPRSCSRCGRSVQLPGKQAFALRPCRRLPRQASKLVWRIR
jgi:hypothetical protein